MLFDPQALADKNAELERAEPQEILRFALAEYAPKVAISTAFGVEGCALIHMAVGIAADVQVFTVDTGYLFAETQALKARFAEELGVRITTFEPAQTVEEQAEAHGPRLYERDSEQCCALRKVEPTRRALAGLTGWIAGLRRDQSVSRSNTQILELLRHADGSPLVKVHPFARWTRQDTWRYVLDHEVPYNPLLDQGYKSLGCWPCTRAVAPGEPERAGRWNGKKSECGIHTFMQV